MTNREEKLRAFKSQRTIDGKEYLEVSEVEELLKNLDTIEVAAGELALELSKLGGTVKNSISTFRKVAREIPKEENLGGV